MTSFNIKGSRFMGRGALASQVPFIFPLLVHSLLTCVCLNQEHYWCSERLGFETVNLTLISTSWEIT